jgi:flagellar biosynthesis protein FlhB
VKRTEAPSPERLLALRKIGVAPISGGSLKWARLALALSIGAIFIKMQGDEFLKFGAIVPTVGDSIGLIVSALKVLSMSVLVAIALLFFIGFLQSGFMLNLIFRPGSPQSIDPQYPQKERESSFGRLILSTFISLGSFFVAVWLGMTLIWPEFIKILNRQPEDIPVAAVKLGEFFLWSTAGLAALLSLSIWLIDRYRFMIRYRMSRAETFKEGD